MAIWEMTPTPLVAWVPTERESGFSWVSSWVLVLLLVLAGSSLGNTLSGVCVV